MIHFYKIPGFYIGGLFGAFGCGKTLALVEHGVDSANYFKKGIASNIRIDESWLRLYAKKCKYDWFAKFGRVTYCKDTLDLLTQENKVILFDEGGIELFSRGFKDRSRTELLEYIFKLRHYRNYMLYTAQGKEQIDKQLRDRTDIFVYCKGFQSYDKKLGHARLVKRSLYYLSPLAFEKFEMLGKNKLIYPIWASNFRFRITFCGLKEKILFRAYQSFDKSYRKIPMEYTDYDRINSFSVDRTKQHEQCFLNPDQLRSFTTSSNGHKPAR